VWACVGVFTCFLPSASASLSVSYFRLHSFSHFLTLPHLLLVPTLLSSFTPLHPPLTLQSSSHCSPHPSYLHKPELRKFQSQPCHYLPPWLLLAPQLVFHFILFARRLLEKHAAAADAQAAKKMKQRQGQTGLSWSFLESAERPAP
jgi:hypothetical protein